MTSARIEDSRSGRPKRHELPDVRLQAWRAPPVAADDACRIRCEENARGFINTARYCAA